LSSHKYTHEQLSEAVKTSFSVRQVLTKLKLKEAGGNYKTIKTLIVNLQLDTSHFHGMLWNKGKNFGPRRPIEDYLSNEQAITSYKLKQRLIKDDIKEYKCENCMTTEWLGELIPLELHHIDGNNANNNLTNIKLLCPNCHALTDNYRSKNRK
jgi:5-methylcytosine-specific restriction endonuclease McrA